MKRTPLADYYEGGESPQPRRATPTRLLRNAAHLYRLRVREQPLQEVLALFGIAAGVALLFAVQIGITSLTGAAGEMARAISGKATIEVAARSPAGMSQKILAQVQQLPIVQSAAPVLAQRVTVVGPRGNRPLTLVGVDERLQRTGGPLIRKFSEKHEDLDAFGLYLTSTTAQAIGVDRGQRVIVQSGGESREALLAGLLTEEEFGRVAANPIALAPLGQAQKLTNSPNRISRVLVLPKPGRAEEAQRELAALAAGQLDVRPSDTEVQLLAQALKPDQQSSALFSAIAVVLGMLFAYNAMLLSTSQRRRMTAYLRMLGASRATVVGTLVFEAILLGIAASLVGIVLGDILSRVAFQSIPEYLASGFPIGSLRIVDFKIVAVSFAGGLAAALLASIKPALDLYRVNPGEAIHEHEPQLSKAGLFGGAVALWAGLGVIASVSVLVVIFPIVSPVGLVAMIFGFALMFRPILSFALSAISRVTRSRGGVSFALAVDELVGTPARTAALGLIAAGAMMGLVTIGGARLDIERGVSQLSSEFFAPDEVWVAPGGQSNPFLTQPFDPRRALEQLRDEPAVRSASLYHGSFLDLREQRVLVMARPSNGPYPLAPSQVVEGDADLAIRRVRSGGWVALSSSVANELGDKLGGRVVIPTPSGDRSFRLAAVTANYGWPSGSIVMNPADYKRAWQSDAPGALILRLAPGRSPSAGKQAVAQALGPETALHTQTSDEMSKQIADSLVQGLARTRQIAALVLGATILAIVSAMFAAVWQRRRRLAALRTIGMYRRELYSTLFFETALIVFLGGLGGLALGLYCQIFASRWIEITSGFRTPFEPAVAFGVVTLIEVLALAILATAGPAFLASRIAPQTGETN